MKVDISVIPPSGPDYTALRASFRADLLARIAPFKCEYDIRQYLQGIRVEAAGDRPGVYLVASDGHRLMIAYDKDGMITGDDGAGIILKAPKELVSACRRRPLKMLGQPLSVLITGRRVSVGAGWGSIGGDNEFYVLPGVPFVQGQYARWRSVLPQWDKLKPGAANCVNPRYLAAFAAAADPIKSGNSSTGIHLWQEAPDKQIVVQYAGGDELLGILMPLRDKVDGESLRKRLWSIVDVPKLPEPVQPAAEVNRDAG